MGRASTAKRQRRRTLTVAHVEVICPGMLEVLSVGKGDLRITVGGNDPDEIAKGRALIEEMLSKGYGIFVETDRGVSRVKRFNPKRMSYIVAEFPAAETEAAPTPTPIRAKRRPVEREIPVAGSRAKAVGRTAGG